jgi:signal transduction histidine kinase
MWQVFGCLTHNHTPWLIFLALTVCVLGAVAVFAMLGRVKAPGSRIPQIWIALAGLTAGACVWATHFVAMLGYDPGVPVHFRADIVVISLLVSLVTQFAATQLIVRAPFVWLKAAMGALSGLGVAFIHFLGIEGMFIQGLVLHDRTLEIFAVLIGVVGMAGAVAAYWRTSSRGLGAALFVLSICVIHFVSMSALSVVPMDVEAGPNDALTLQMLGLAIGAGVAILLAMGLSAALAEGYLSDRQRLENVRLRRSVESRTAELAQLAEKQAELKEAAESASAAKSQFLASMSHELRTPLNAIIGYSELIMEEEVEASELVRSDATKIRSAAMHLLSMINEILDFSKIDAGRMSLDVVEFSASSLIEEAADLVAAAVAKKGLSFSVDAPVDLGPLRTDRLKLKQCVVNLLSNAVKFTDAGVVRLTCRRECRAGVDVLRIAVEDSGIGMDAEQVSALFQPFVQVSDGSERARGGTGLGLVISQKLLEMMGGEITVQSRPGVGTTFHITVPCEVECVAQRAAA